jgi:hypothetical protein
MLLNHTGCGFTTFTDDELNAKLAASIGDRPHSFCGLNTTSATKKSVWINSA